MGWLTRLLRRSPSAVAALDPDDPRLIVVLRAYDAARADSAVLAEAGAGGLDLSAPVLVRHHLVGLPDAASVVRAGELLGQDGYTVRPVCPLPPGVPPLAVHAVRTQVLTALSASQERSRMAGLAQRLGGDVRGWDALAPHGPAGPAGPPGPIASAP